jgi:hypothetical protein
MVFSGEHVAVLVAGYDLTGDMNRIAIDDSRKMQAASVFGDVVAKFIPGQRMAKLNHQGFMNAASAQAHPVLKGLAVDGVLSILLGQNADPVDGDLAYHLMSAQEQYQVAPQIGQVIPFRASFANKGDEAGWGVALAVPVTITNSSNGSSIDNGAASSNGGAVFLHILQAAATDTYSIIVEGSATGVFGGEETTVATFTLNGSQINSERVAAVTSIPRYLRYKATRTGSAGDNLRLAISVVRF